MSDLNIPALNLRPWMARAACRDHPDPDIFFRDGEAAAAAVEVCHGCRVKAECLEYALSDPGLEGTWGGMSEKERKTWRAVKARAEGAA